MEREDETMTNAQVLDLFYEFFLLAVKLSGPVLFISMAIGILIAIFQAATQIHEQTVTFVPKLLCIAVLLLLFGSSMLNLLQEFTREVFSMI